MAGIFKAYDIRGIHGETLNEELAYQIGLGFANFLGSGKRIVCGRDGRSHSLALQHAFIDGACDGGLDVINMGLCTTPMTYFAGFSDGLDGSTMVTASHNSGEYNGFKFCREEARPIGYDDGLHVVEDKIQSQALVKAATKGQVTEKDYRHAYLDFLVDQCEFSKTFHFAVDCGNGMGGFLIQEFLERTEQRGEPLYWELDFSFPNHLANPLDFENLRDLKKYVASQNLDFGVAFDGDADRCFFVDDTGEVIPADILTTLIANYILDNHGPTHIVYDIRSSRVVKEEIEKRGGTPHLCRVGHSYMKSMLRKTGGLFGGELAGHFYYQSFSFADSAFLTMITVMNILSSANQPLSQLVRPLKKYFTSGEINFITTQADQLIEEADVVFPGGDKLTIDGVRLDFPDWWFSLRKSNTEPLLRLVVEAATQVKLDEAVKQIKDWVLSRGGKLH